MRLTAYQLCQEALLHCERARRYAERDLSDPVVVDAIALRMAAMIDVLHRLPDSVRQECFGDEWVDIWGMRNRIVHGYMTVDPRVITVTVQQDLAQVEHEVRCWMQDHAQ
ncbi:DUF86 domain-containing protein [Actinomyces faecalis]|uniref:HepT-like ribonuclease domain-containing protein n=1 Tax=Actinomyces faecalis TaxID=2722820 RepID=UPI001554C748|nr:HepT-like ribonuclease domain-containing protein [Actinomyces faecalis]